MAEVADDDVECAVADAGEHLEGTLLPLVIGVDGRVDAGLGGDGLDIGDPRLVHPGGLGEPGQRVAHQADVLRPSRQDESHDGLI